MKDPLTKQECPFCGGRDIRSHHRGHPSSGEWVIECHNCSCELTGFASEQDAWKTWNGRWKPVLSGDSRLPSSNLQSLCEVCGKPATQWMLRDPFGKSDAKRPLCGEHGLRFRDPADVAEIERLRAALEKIDERLSRAVGGDADRLRAIIAQALSDDSSAPEPRKPCSICGSSEHSHLHCYGSVHETTSDCPDPVDAKHGAIVYGSLTAHDPHNVTRALWTMTDYWRCAKPRQRDNSAQETSERVCACIPLAPRNDKYCGNCGGRIPKREPDKVDCGNPVMVNTEWYGPCTRPSGHDGECERVTQPVSVSHWGLHGGAPKVPDETLDRSKPDLPEHLLKQGYRSGKSEEKASVPHPCPSCGQMLTIPNEVHYCKLTQNGLANSLEKK